MRIALEVVIKVRGLALATVVERGALLAFGRTCLTLIGGFVEVVGAAANAHTGVVLHQISRHASRTVGGIDTLFTVI